MEFNSKEYEQCQILLRGEYKNRRANQTISQMQSTTGLICEWSVFRHLQEQGFDLQPDRDNKSVYNPDAMFTALAKYTNVTKLSYDKVIYDQAYALTLKAFCVGHKVRPDMSRNSLRAAVKGNKSSGAPEFTKKEVSFDHDLSRMSRWMLGKKAPEPCVAYHRVQHGVQGPKNRLVWGYPQSMTLAEAIFARPLIDHFLHSNTPMAFGLKRVHLSARLVPILNVHYKYGFDFSGFDSSISPELISMAFSVLSHCIEFEDEEQKDVFWRVCNYFIHTPILMPDGKVYQKHKGVPSGSYFTQMVDSIVNYFVIQYATIKLSGKAIFNDKILVLGDDSLFSLDVSLKVEQYAEILSALGMTLNVQKTGKYVDRPVHFLGHAWYHGLVSRDPSEIAKRMAFPENHSDIEDPRDRIRSRVYSYFDDAIEAAEVIYRWSRIQDDPYHKLMAAGTINDQGEIGWRRLMSTLREDAPSDREQTLYPRVFTGILK